VIIFSQCLQLASRFVGCCRRTSDCKSTYWQYCLGLNKFNKSCDMKMGGLLGRLPSYIDSVGFQKWYKLEPFSWLLRLASQDFAPSHAIIGVVIWIKEKFLWDEDKKGHLISGVTKIVLHETASNKFWQLACRDTVTPSNTGLPSVYASMDTHFLCIGCGVGGCLTVS
jgi:hypothetical protein